MCFRAKQTTCWYCFFESERRPFLLESIDFATDATDGVQKTQPWKEQEEPRKGNDVVFALSMCLVVVE